MKILHITFVFCSFLSCNALFSLEKLHYKSAQKNNFHKEISSDYIVGTLVTEAAWILFCKIPCNKRLFNKCVLPEGHNIFRPCRELGNMLEEPYKKENVINKEIKIDNNNDTVASNAVRGCLKIRDECFFSSGKNFTNPIKSGLLFTSGLLIETEILRTGLLYEMISGTSNNNTNTIKKI